MSLQMNTVYKRNEFTNEMSLQIKCVYKLNEFTNEMSSEAIQVLHNAEGGVGVKCLCKKRYECERFNVISLTMRWVGVNFPEKKRYVILEWPFTN